VDYRRVLQKGLGDVARRTEEKLEALDLIDPENMKASFFYRAILIAVDAVACFAARFAALAQEMAETAEPQRARELQEIARICRKVPMEPAETFQEALQSVWFIHLILQIESNGHSLSFGRLDQFCYPYYKRSREAGMTRQQASDAAGTLGLYILVTGNTEVSPNVTVTSQSEPKDTMVPGGTTITLTFTDTTARD
jgi:formate C-acetyltransferase